MLLTLCLLFSGVTLTLAADAENKADDIPPEQKARLEEAYKKIVDQDEAGALKILDEVIAANGQIAQAYFFRGIAKGHSGNMESAIADITKCIELSPKARPPYRVRALLYFTSGKFSEAIPDFQKYLDVTVVKGYDISAPSRNDADSVEQYGLALFCEGKDDVRAFNTLLSAHQLFQDPERKLWIRFFMWALNARHGRHEVIKSAMKEEVDAEVKRRADEAKKKKETDKTDKDSTKSEDEWDIVIGRYLTDELSESDLLSTAEASPANTLPKRLCEAYYFVGMKYQAAGKLDSAKTYFNKSIETKSFRTVEHSLAVAELALIKAKADKPAK